ncbi:MAG: helix-turn-helix domain-containing protein [Clostridiales bacterium]|jgi:hypothetical protein|nr:helix-turn-helix domain-containing protein [Clostridiales bacterium]
MVLLSSEIITYELSKAFELYVAASRHQELCLGLPVLYRNETPLESNRVYIVPRGFRPNVKAISAMFICVSEGQDILPEGDETNSAVYIQNEHDPITLINCLLEIYNKYDAWDRSLKEVSLKNGKLLDMLRPSLPIFCNNLHIADNYLMPVLQTYYSETPEDSKEDFTTKTAPIELIVDIYEQTRDSLEVHKNDKHPYYLPPIVRGGGYGFMVRRLYRDGVHSGFLSIEETNAFRLFDKHLLDWLADYVEHIFPVDMHSSDNPLAGALSDMLKGETVNTNVVNWILLLNDMKITDTYQCLVLSRTEDIAVKLIDYIFSNLTNAISIMRDKYFVLFLNQTMRKGGINESERLAALLTRLGVRGGLSSSFSGLTNARLYFTQAKETLKIGMAAKAGSYLYEFKDYCCDYIVKSSSGELEPEMLYSDGFKRLIEFNKNVAFDVFETLKIYLDENMNAAKAAKRMFIQRNSFLYRLERIVKILGEDLQDPDVRFRINVYLRHM